MPAEETDQLVVFWPPHHDALLPKLLSGELRMADSPKRLRRFHACRIINATDPSK
jgi:hypothetical protein